MSGLEMCSCLHLNIDHGRHGIPRCDGGGSFLGCDVRCEEFTPATDGDRERLEADLHRLIFGSAAGDPRDAPEETR